MKWLVLGLGWSYVAGLAFVALAMRCDERWWWANLLLFGPRWLAAVPLAAVAPSALFARRRQGWLLLTLSVVLSAIVLGWNVPVRASWATAEGRVLRVLTCNIGGARQQAWRLEKYLFDVQPDVVAIEECSDAWLSRLQAGEEWHVEHRGGLCLASRFPLSRVTAMQDDGGLGYWGTYALLCRVELPETPVTVCVVHLETPREGLDEVLGRGWRAAGDVQAETSRRARISALARRFTDQVRGPLVVLGDFNLPVESAIYRRDWSDLTNAFSATGWGMGQTKYTRWFGLRIDHVLTKQFSIERCQVGPDVASDHRPVVADLMVAGAGDRPTRQ